MRYRPARLFLLLALGAVWLPAQAGIFDDDEARARVEKLRNDLAEQAKRIETGANAQLDLANQIEVLKGELAKVRGQLEMQNYEVEATKKRQTDFYNDLDARMRKLESVQAEAKAAPAPALPQVDPAAETSDYGAALSLFQLGKHREALSALQNFIATYPKSAVLPGAHLWAARAHGQLREFAKAAEMYGKLVQNWPSDPKAPDALFEQAGSLEQGGDAKGMKKALETLVERYPDSTAAQAARLRLKRK